MEDNLLLSILLQCGKMDITVIKSIEPEIIEEAIHRLEEEGLVLNFPNLYFICAKVGLNKVGIDDEKAEIDNNYISSAIYLKGVSKRKIKELKELGFTV